MASKRVLIVDDSRSARHVLKRLLKQYEITVDEVESAEDALQYLLYNKPHAIFMDHMMPGMDGLQALRIIKGNPATGLIPIVMFTSKEGGGVYLNQARALGAEGVLPKQIESSDLEAVLDSLHLLDADEPVEVQTQAETDSIVTKAAPDEASEEIASVTPAASPAVQALAQQAAEDEIVRILRPHLDAQARRLQSSMRAEIRHLTEKVQAGQRPASRRQWRSIAAGLVAGVILTSSLQTLLPARSHLGSEGPLGSALSIAEVCRLAELEP